MCAGTKYDSKDWGEKNWENLVTKMSIQFPEFAIVFIGSKDEFTQGENISRGCKIPFLNLAGMINPRVSLGVIKLGRIFIGHDSGPMHMAAAIGTPLVAIFSAQNKPGEWFPHSKESRVIYHQTECFGCNLKECILEKKKCILSISVDEVLVAISSLI